MQAPKISKVLFKELMRIEPSEDIGIHYRPCKLTLENGSTFDRVYAVEATADALERWRSNSFEKLLEKLVNVTVDLQTVTRIEESPFRIPAKLANKMYKAGESGMGYCVFTLVLKDGGKLPYCTMDLIDFPNLPPGVTTEMIIDLQPHVGKEKLQDDKHRWKDPPDPYTMTAPYSWCFYSKPE